MANAFAAVRSENVMRKRLDAPEPQQKREKSPQLLVSPITVMATILAPRISVFGPHPIRRKAAITRHTAKIALTSAFGSLVLSALLNLVGCNQAQSLSSDRPR